MKDTKTVVKDIERDLVINMTLGVKYGRLSLKEAKQISKEFMASYPYKDKNDLFAKIYFLSEKYKLVRKVYVKHIEEFEVEKTENILNNMRNFMKLNDIENAIRVAKGDASLMGLNRKEGLYG